MSSRSQHRIVAEPVDMGVYFYRLIAECFVGVIGFGTVLKRTEFKKIKDKEGHFLRIVPDTREENYE